MDPRAICSCQGKDVLKESRSERHRLEEAARRMGCMKTPAGICGASTLASHLEPTILAGSGPMLWAFPYLAVLQGANDGRSRLGEGQQGHA